VNVIVTAPLESTARIAGSNSASPPAPFSAAYCALFGATGDPIRFQAANAFECSSSMR
jgi:hypothetical protein